MGRGPWVTVSGQLAAFTYGPWRMADGREPSASSLGSRKATVKAQRPGSPSKAPALATLPATQVRLVPITVPSATPEGARRRPPRTVVATVERREQDNGRRNPNRARALFETDARSLNLRERRRRRRYARPTGAKGHRPTLDQTEDGKAPRRNTAPCTTQPMSILERLCHVARADTVNF